MIIVIDTNALEGDRYASRPVADAAWRGAAAGDFEIVVPEAVIAELVKHFPVALSQTLAELDAAIRKRGRELATFGIAAPTVPGVDQAALAAGYEAALRARCTQPGCTVAPLADLSLALRWAITRRHPFDSSGRGLPDAAIWLTVLELAATDDVILVSNDGRAFGSPGQLPDALRHDIRERALDEHRIRVVVDLFALQREIVAPAAEAETRVKRLLETSPSSLPLADRLVEVVRQSPLDAAFDFYLDDPPQIADLDADGFVVESAQALDDRQILARLRTRCEVLLDMVVSRDEYQDAQYEGVALEPFDAERHAFTAETWVAGDLTIDAVIDLDGVVVEATVAEFQRLAEVDELQYRIDGGQGAELLEIIERDTRTRPTVEPYRPPEAIFSSVGDATVVTWQLGGQVTIDQLRDRDGDGALLGLLIGGRAAISWLVPAPEPSDLARFSSLAEGTEHGGGYLHGDGDEEPIVVSVTARLSHDGWEDVEVVDIALRPETLEERSAAALAAEYELDDPSDR